MTTATTTAIEYVRYAGRPWGVLPSWGPAVEGAVQGSILRITPESLPSTLRYIHGDDVERAIFTPVDPKYVATLPHCETHGVYFESDMVRRSHEDWHQRRRDQSEDLRVVNGLTRKALAKQAEVQAAQAELDALQAQIITAQEKMAQYQACEVTK